jgi:hypothetical protein
MKQRDPRAVLVPGYDYADAARWLRDTGKLDREIFKVIDELHALLPPKNRLKRWVWARKKNTRQRLVASSWREAPGALAAYGLELCRHLPLGEADARYAWILNMLEKPGRTKEQLEGQLHYDVLAMMGVLPQHVKDLQVDPELVQEYRRWLA